MNTNIEESTISRGIQEFEKFKLLAAEAVERCKKAEEQAHYYKGQNEMLIQQRISDDNRHRADLNRIAELEGFVSSILDQYRSAEEKLRLGHFRRPNSTRTIPDTVRTAIEDELKKLSQPNELLVAKRD